MSGGTRCNVTHATDAQGIAGAFGPPGRFLHSALAALSPQGLLDLLAAEGVPTKVESTGKVFPVSDKAADVLAALVRRLQRSGESLATGEAVRRMEKRGDRFQLSTTRQELAARTVVITTGGKSYPGSGTTGDGYAWAAELGHAIVTPRPALTPILSGAAWVKTLRGVAVADTAVRVVVSETGTSRRQGDGCHAGPARHRRDMSDRHVREGRLLTHTRGSLLFTHFGVSGPAVLDASRAVSGYPQSGEITLHCDFLPESSPESLTGWLQACQSSDGKRQLAGLIAQRLPRRLVQCLLQPGGWAEQRVAEVSRRDLARCVQTLKNTQIPVAGVWGFKKAEVTAGGVDLRDVDSRSMQSKRTQGLYLAGEVLDLDGPIGGYNFQAAFSTGWLAGESV